VEDIPQYNTPTEHHTFFNPEALFGLTPPAFDVIGPSQQPDAPFSTQTQDPFCTPNPPPRPSREVRAPSPLTYPTDHVYAQQQAARRRRGEREAPPKRGRH
jgi:hypothetical protein